MTSDLLIDWMPCNPSNGRGGPSSYVSWWYFRQSDLLQSVPPEIQEFFRSENISPDRSIKRHMWTTAGFAEVDGWRYCRRDNQLRWIQSVTDQPDASRQDVTPDEFVPIRCTLDSTGKAVWSETTEASRMRIFKVLNETRYQQAMFEFLQQQYGSLSTAANRGPGPD